MAAKEKRNTKSEIIFKSMPLITKRGFRTTSIGDIIGACGVKKGCFYHHFADKEQFGLELLQCARAGFLDFLDTELAGKTPGDALSRFLYAALSVHRRSEFVGGCPFGNLALEMADENRRYADAVMEVFSEWTDKLEKVISAAKKKGQIRKDIPSRTLAAHIIMAIEGGIMLSRLEKDERHLKNCVESLKKMLFISSVGK